MIKHKHHIVPKHMNGTNDASNLIELTVEEHAEAHRVLFEKYGKKEDELAWKALAGIIDKQECVHALQKEGGKRSAKKMYEQNKHNFQLKNASNYDHVRKLRSERMIGNTLGSKRVITQDLREKLASKSKGNMNVRDTIWWNNGKIRKRSKTSPGKEWKKGFSIDR